MTIEENIKTLAGRGEKRGYITYDEINAAFPKGTLSAEQLDKVMVDLLLLGVQIIEQGSPADIDSQA